MQSESQTINALWEADRKGFNDPLRKAILAARDNGMTDGQIAEELMTTTEKIAELAAEPQQPRS